MKRFPKNIENMKKLELERNEFNSLRTLRRDFDVASPAGFRATTLISPPSSIRIESNVNDAKISPFWAELFKLIDSVDEISTSSLNLDIESSIIHCIVLFISVQKHKTIKNEVKQEKESLDWIYKIYQVTSGAGLPLTLHSNVALLSSFKSLLTSFVVNTGASIFSV